MTWPSPRAASPPSRPTSRYASAPRREVIDAGGRYLVPGLCDGHMHVESGMLTPAEFAAP